MPIDVLCETQGAAHDVLKGLPDGMLHAATPCTEWDLEALIGHLLMTQALFFRLATGRAPNGASESDDFVGTFDREAADVLVAVSTNGFDTRVLDLPFGQFTGEQFIDFVSLETLTHAWDVAKATAQDTDLAPRAADHLLVVATRTMGGPSRGPGRNFQAVQPAPPLATSADRLAAFLGRSVG